MSFRFRVPIVLAFVVAMSGELLSGFGCVGPKAPNSAFFCGDGKVIDAGATGFPRYRVVFPSIAAAYSEKNRFELDKPPTMSGTLIFLVETRESRSPVESLAKRQAATKKLPLTVHCRLLRNDDTVIVDTRSSKGGWNVATSANTTELWHESLRDLKIRANSTYIIEIDVDSHGPIPDGIVITPELRGGGHERP